MDDRHVSNPGNRPVSDEVARNRWLVINAVRLAGVAIVLVGILGLRGVIEYPAVAGYILVAVGLFDVFAAPILLARKWRTPTE
jgi:hypothetical protein